MIKKILNKLLNKNTNTFKCLKKRILYKQIINDSYKLNKYKKIVFPKNLKDVFINNISKNKIYKNACIYACFSNKGLIENYHIYTLKELNKIFDLIIVVFDNPLLPLEIKKIEPYFQFLQCKRHNMYDFGSYKIGYKIIKENKLYKKLDHICILNDSCFGPIFDLKHTISIMDKKNLDFWGLTQNESFETHIQSYFYFFNTKIIKSNYIYMFLKKVKKVRIYQEAVLKYEVQFTNYLKSKGFIFDTLVTKEIGNFVSNSISSKALLPASLIKECNIPFIKIKEFSEFFTIVDQREETLNLIKTYNPVLYEVVKTFLLENKMLQ